MRRRGRWLRGGAVVHEDRRRAVGQLRHAHPCFECARRAVEGDQLVIEAHRTVGGCEDDVQAVVAGIVRELRIRISENADGKLGQRRGERGRRDRDRLSIEKAR